MGKHFAVINGTGHRTIMTQDIGPDGILWGEVVNYYSSPDILYLGKFPTGGPEDSARMIRENRSPFGTHGQYCQR